VFVRRLALLGVTVAALLGLSTVGLMATEGVGAWYAFRWALDTVATVGGFTEPRTAAGQIIHALLILLGVGTLFYALATLTEFFVGGELGEVLTARRAQKMIDSLADHYIICGYGRVGRQVAHDLRAAHLAIVVIDALPDNRDVALALGVGFIEGDASNDAVLLQAGIQRARSIIACADSDPQNIFITLTARELRSDIVIVARAALEDSEKKLIRAGADRVVSPYKSSGVEMARLASHPQLRGVVDVDSEYRLEEIAVGAGCKAAGETLGAIRGGAMIVGLRRGEVFHPQPSADMALAAGDIISAMGTPTTLARLEDLLES
jgi:voltage-gated potassium channel